MLEDVRIGAYKLHVEADKKFRYMSTSPSDLRAVTDDYAVILQENTSINIGLMEGFLTLPLLEETQSQTSNLQPRQHPGTCT